jgi:DNA (cytosine-5)-methyltransferase 1
MKVLNLYAGIGGNRKLWEDVEVTSVEYEPKIAAQYKELYPNDNLIVGDAHEYLLDHYREFDFIWSSPPCQTHSRTNYFTNEIRKRSRYPDMSLYQEIIFLNQFFKGKFCVENVIGYYEPLIKPTKIGRHYLWSNFNIPLIKVSNKDIGTMDCDYGNTACKIPIEQRNAVASDLGLHVLNTARGIITQNKVEQSKLF